MKSLAYWESSGNLGVGTRLLAGDLTSLPGLLELAIMLLKDHLLQSLQLVGRGDVSDRGMQTHRVVVRDEIRDTRAGLRDGTGTGRTDALAFETAMPAFQLAVGLGVVGAGADMCDPHETDELLEVPGDELGAIVGDDPWLDAGMLFQGFLQDDLDFRFFHGFPKLPVDASPGCSHRECW